MNTVKKMMLAATVAVSGLTAATAANATITIYTTQAAFLAAVSAPGVDTFNDLSTTTSTASPLNRTAGAYTYRASVSTTSFFGAGSGTDHWLSTNTATDTITFSNFSAGVRGVGGQFFGSDIAGLFAAGNISVSATDASGTVNQLLTLPTTTTFLGFVSNTGLTSLTVSAVQGATPLWPTVNNLTLAAGPVAAAVPEPATWGMMILGFGMIGAASRSRKVKTTVSFA
jgi:hypothetical protein